MTGPFPFPDAPVTYPAGTLDLDAVKLAIFQWIQSVTRGIIPDGQILWRNQSEPLPPRPCVTLKIINGPTPVGRSANMIPQGDVTNQNFNYGIQMEMALSVQVFGNSKVANRSALQLTLDLNSSLMRQSILDKLKKAGVSIQGKGQPRNLTALEETEYEERAGFDIDMGLVQNVIDQPGTIETVEMAIEAEGQPTRDVTMDLT